MKITKIELKIIFDLLNVIMTENLSREQGFVEFHDSETVFLSLNSHLDFFSTFVDE